MDVSTKSTAWLDGWRAALHLGEAAFDMNPYDELLQQCSYVDWGDGLHAYHSATREDRFTWDEIIYDRIFEQPY